MQLRKINPCTNIYDIKETLSFEYLKLYLACSLQAFYKTTQTPLKLTQYMTIINLQVFSMHKHLAKDNMNLIKC